MHRVHVAVCLFVTCTLPFANGAHANGVFQNLTGDVRAAEGASSLESVSVAQRFRPGTRIATGIDGRAVLKLDDGHTLVIDANTEIRIAAYRFDRDRPQQDTMRLELASGAVRSASGLMGQRSGERVTLAVPHASFGLGGADSTVMLADIAYVSVLWGNVAVHNGAGTATFAQGSVGSVTGPSSLAAPISPLRLPRAVSDVFAALSRVAVGPGLEPRSGGASLGVLGMGAGANLAASAGALLLGVAAVAAATASSTSAPSHH